MNDEMVLRVVFFRTPAGREPVREWLQSMDKDDRKMIGEDIKLVQFRWPLGLPLVRKLEAELWEVRSHLSGDVLRAYFLPLPAAKWRFCMGLSKITEDAIN